MTVNKSQIDELIKTQKTAFIADYKKIVESPSISANPENKKDIQETARIASDFLRAAGAEVKVFETKGNPVVYGHIQNDPKAQTVAVYNHLDVQPAEKGKDGWTLDPFKFTEKDGRFYSRGTTDDKGPAMSALWGARMARQLKVPTNIEFIWELEEEIGSIHFEEFLHKAKSTVKANSVVISDTLWLAKGKPAAPIGLRGLMTVKLKLRTAKKDTHSGLTGGAARNPLTELCAVVAGCIEARTGEIKIPGFEKTWTPPTKEERAEFARSGFSVQSFKAAHQLEKMRTENIEEVTSRVWASPTFEVHGITGGYQGPGMKTIIPPEAEVKISLRLVPGQDYKQIFQLLEKHVKNLNPDCEATFLEQHPPYLAPKENPLVEKIKQAYEFGFGAKPALIREGGSIGAAVHMNKILETPVLFLGLSLPEDSYHGPDESFAWEQIDGGVKSFVRYFELLAQK